jgi:glycolate oxidase FAD binding subunit
MTVQIEQFREQVLAAARPSARCASAAAAPRTGTARRCEGDILDTRAYSGIVDYEPTELVITARCGTPLAEIEAALAKQGPDAGLRAAALRRRRHPGRRDRSGLSGPRRATSGAVRDFVLGAKLMDGRGESAHLRRPGDEERGRLRRLAPAGRLDGHAGPDAAACRSRCCRAPCARPRCVSMSEIDALRRLNEWGGQPLPMSASCWHDGVLTVRLSGAQAAVDAAVRSSAAKACRRPRVLGQPARTAAPVLRRRGSLWRLSVPSPRAPSSSRRAADRVGRRAALAQGRPTLDARTSARGGGGRRPRDAVPRRRQERRRVPAAGAGGGPHHERLKAAFDPRTFSIPDGCTDMQTNLADFIKGTPKATKPKRSCAPACIAASAPPPARPTRCWATSSMARAAAST